MRIPNALSIAGSDPSGGAGIQADLKTFSALGVYGAAAITALTAQNTLGVRAVHDVPLEFFAAQLEAVFEDLRLDAVKIGMLGDAAKIGVLVELLDRHAPPAVVLDPVLHASDGTALYSGDEGERLLRELVPRAQLLTPNLPEAALLLGEDVARVEADPEGACARLIERGARAVLLKGGHREGPECSDLLLRSGGSPTVFASPRVETSCTHGTGCTLSSAIASHLAHGSSLEDAVSSAKAFVTSALQAAAALVVGRGHGPLHHFHELWPWR